MLEEIKKLKSDKLHDIQTFENKHGYSLPKMKEVLEEIAKSIHFESVQRNQLQNPTYYDQTLVRLDRELANINNERNKLIDANHELPQFETKVNQIHRLYDKKKDWKEKADSFLQYIREDLQSRYVRDNQARFLGKLEKIMQKISSVHFTFKEDLGELGRIYQDLKNQEKNIHRLLEEFALVEVTNLESVYTTEESYIEIMARIREEFLQKQNEPPRATPKDKLESYLDSISQMLERIKSESFYSYYKRAKELVEVIKTHSEELKKRIPGDDVNYRIREIKSRITSLHNLEDKFQKLEEASEKRKAEIQGKINFIKSLLPFATLNFLSHAESKLQKIESLLKETILEEDAYKKLSKELDDLIQEFERAQELKNKRALTIEALQEVMKTQNYKLLDIPGEGELQVFKFEIEQDTFVEITIALETGNMDFQLILKTTDENHDVNASWVQEKKKKWCDFYDRELIERLREMGIHLNLQAVKPEEDNVIFVTKQRESSSKMSEVHLKQAHAIKNS